MTGSSKTVGLCLLGGTHQILHLIPIAAELSKYENIETIIFVTSEEERMMSASVLSGLGKDSADIRILKANPTLFAVFQKLGVLFTNMKRLKRLDALIVAERTSTILRYTSRSFPLFIHIPHGAGDRAKSYDSRIRHFDHVLAAGEKDKARMIELGLVSEETCHVTGYIKPFAVRQLGRESPRLFKTEKTTVLYNPHFSQDLSSWQTFGSDLLDRFAAAPHLNFIFAPHMRLFQNAAPDRRAALGAYAKYPNIHIDLGSAFSTDMTYTRAADIYLGDVSSQVYEFLSKPKPCVFLGSKDVIWRENPDYAHWHYGRVCHSVGAVMTALDAAHIDHDTYVEIQKSGCLAAMGHPDWNPIERAAKVVKSLLG